MINVELSSYKENVIIHKLMATMVTVRVLSIMAGVVEIDEPRSRAATVELGTATAPIY